MNQCNVETDHDNPVAECVSIRKVMYKYNDVKLIFVAVSFLYALCSISSKTTQYFQ